MPRLRLPCEAASLKFIVSFTTPIADHAKDGYLARRRRFQMAKLAVALFFAFVLMYVGLHGKQHAGVQARLNDLALLRDQLQQKLDNDQLVGCVPRTRTNSTWSPSSDPAVGALVSAFKARLWQFDADYSQARLSEVERFELRLTETTLANAEGRFADALGMITDKDQNATGSTSEAQTNRLVRVLDIRADSFYGLHQWQNALDHYRQLLILQPNQLVALSRVAECEYAIGKTNEALSTCAELARSHKHRANALRIQGKADAAIAVRRDARRRGLRPDGGGHPAHHSGRAGQPCKRPGGAAEDRCRRASGENDMHRRAPRWRHRGNESAAGSSAAASRPVRSRNTR